VLRGHVLSIVAAIEDRDRQQSQNLLPNVNPAFSWVRLAQRIPVRVALDEVPADFRMIAGRTATVSVRGIGPSMGRRPAASDATAASAASAGAGASATGAAIVGTAPSSATHSASGASQ
jgi:multidrug resistance efflux pump